LRVLCAHRYRCRSGARSFLDQVLDANNFPNGLAWLWAPLGLRYHAIHHLFPALPYHVLGEAYRRVMGSLPADSAFRQTCRPSLLAGLDDVIGRRRANGPST
jgi:fatty acid desaturase